MQVIANKYKLGEIIYTSDLTWVYEASFVGSSREAREIPLIVKTIPRVRLDEDQAKILKERVRSEAHALSRLNNPFIVKAIDLVEEATVPYLVMRRRSINLSQYLQTKGKLSLSAAIPLLYNLATSLDYAHTQGFIHRDIKPDNILLDLDANGQPLYAYITDFGIAHFQERRMRTETNQLMGTMAYMPPERWEGKETTNLSDVYAFGLVAYEMLTAHALFKSGDAVQEQIKNIMNPSPKLLQGIRARLDADVALVIMKAISRNPEDRYPSATDFADSLGKLLAATALDKVNLSIARNQAEAGRADERALALISEKHRGFPFLWGVVAALSCFIVGMLFYQLIPRSLAASPTETVLAIITEATEIALEPSETAEIPGETASPTVTPSASSTASPSATASPSITPSPSSTPSPTITPSPSPSLTPSVTPTPLPQVDCRGAGWVLHTVNPNDSLSHYAAEIANHELFTDMSYDEREASIVRANPDIDFRTLTVGGQVCLPAIPRNYVAAPTATSINVGGTDGTGNGSSADSSAQNSSGSGGGSSSSGSSSSGGSSGTTNPTAAPPTVPPPPAINVSVSASCGNGNSGQTTFRVSNNGSGAVNISWTLTEGGSTVTSGSLSLNPGESATAWSGNTKNKNYSLSAGGASASENCG